MLKLLFGVAIGSIQAKTCWKLAASCPIALGLTFLLLTVVDGCSFEKSFLVFYVFLFFFFLI